MDDHHDKLDEIVSLGVKDMIRKAMEEDQCPICFFSLLIAMGVGGLKQSCPKADFVRHVSRSLKVGEETVENLPKNMRMH